MNEDVQVNQNFSRLSELQICYYSNLLTLKKPKWEQKSTNQALIEAKIDPIPHQVEAAVFAFRNPLSGGIILADEVGLGKTIETGLILSQLWAEGRRNFLIIVPKSLRHQWRDELQNLFYLESNILDTIAYRKLLKTSPNQIPDLGNQILITNEHFVDRYPEAVRSIKWDYVVIDEAHKLRNAWKTAKNQAKRAKHIRDILKPYRKLLLTATPMQNNLMELFGLVSFIDPHVLGTKDSFQRTFKSISEEVKQERLSELKDRMGLFFKRELRKNVNDYIQYTKRHAITFPYNPSEDEEELRIKFENYLRRPDLIAIPASASHLLKLVYFKLMASSTFALKNSLLNLYKRLMYQAVFSDNEALFDELFTEISKNLTLSDGRRAHELEKFEKNLYKKIKVKSFTGIKEQLAEYSEIDDLCGTEAEVINNYSDEDLEAKDSLEDSSISGEKVKEEANLVLEFILLSRKIGDNKKAQALVSALKEQFKRAEQDGWPQKAVIFTEFRRTQDYVITALEEFGLSLENDIVIFNGSSGDAESRKKLVEEFRDNKKIFLTTEAGAEGLNLQFANLIINYDLPWNPQRIEQRIGRCHRYGQKLDVIVINFVNKKNVADVRVLELLDEKFNLFKSAFGASDEVLGQIESGTDIEKEIFKIYLNCRNEEEISTAFNELLEKNRELVESKMDEVRKNILDEFDEEVQKKLKKTHDSTVEEIGTIQGIVRDTVLNSLPQNTWSYEAGRLKVTDNVIGLDPGKKYTFERSLTEDCILLHAHSSIINELAKKRLKEGHTKFCYSGQHNISVLTPLVGKNGTWALFKATFLGLENLETLIPVFIIDSDKVQFEAASKLVSISSEYFESTEMIDLPIEKLESVASVELEKSFGAFNEKHEELYDEEVEKIECYFNDLQELKRCQFDDVEKEIRGLKKERKNLPFKAKREINAKIQRKKDQQEKIEDEITELRQKSREEEKRRAKELHDKGEVGHTLTCLLKGTFEVI